MRTSDLHQFCYVWLRAVLLLVATLTLASELQAQISLTTSSVYSQNFNTLASSNGTTSSSLPSGWVFSESGTNANTTYAVGTGSDTGGNTYSFGSSGNSERALGGLRSGNLTPTIGASFVNNTGRTINSFSISYIGEQWRLGATSRVDQLDFQSSSDATSLTTGTWNNTDALDFTAPVTTGALGALDGNASANRTSISNNLGVSRTNGQTIWIRWADVDATGADDGLGVDDFNLTPVFTASTLTWAGSSGATWDNGSTKSFTLSGTSTFFVNSDTVNFGDSNIGVVNVSGTVTSTQVNVTNTSGTYTFQGSGSISGSASIVKSEAGTAIFSSANAYTGGTSIDGGTLAISNANALSTNGTISFGGGTLRYDSLTTDLSARFSNAAGQAYSINTNGNDVTFASALTSSGGTLTKSGAGNLTLSGANTYTGGTTVSAGTLTLSGSGSLGSGSVSVTGGTLDLGGNTITNTIGSITGGTISNGTISKTGGTYDLQAGTLSSGLAGSAGVSKTGSGTVTMSGTNTYSGATTVDAGKLVVSGSVSHSTSNFLVNNLAIVEVNGTVTASTMTVGSNATLAGSGTINAAATVSGTVNPGNSPGTLTFGAGLVLTSTTVLNFELDQNNRTAGDGVNDLMAVTGDLTLDGTLNVPGGTWTTSGTSASPLSWTLFTFTGTVTDNGLALGSMPALTGTPAPQEWKIQVVNNIGGGGSVLLNAVPEPTTGLLLGGLLAGVAVLRRNRRIA